MNGLVKSFGLKRKEVTQVSQKQEVSSWAKESWKKATEKKIIDGTNPKGNLTREQLAVILDRVGLLDK